MSLLKEIKNSNLKLTNYIFTSLIKLHVKMDQLGEFHQVLDLMKSLNVMPNQQIYGVIFSYALTDRNPQIAIDSFNSMVEDNVICEPFYLSSLVK